MQIHCKYSGIKGFINLYEYALRYSYMITNKAKHKAKILSFWKRHGLEATLDAFPVKRPTLFLWKKKLREGNGKLESLNEKSKAPRDKRKRTWPHEIQQEIKRLRKEHPNLGKDKIYPILVLFAYRNNLPCPKPSTIGRIIKDNGGLRVYPQKVSHFGKIKAIKRVKKIRKPKGFKARHPGHLIELDTIVKFVHGMRRYVITFIDVHSRFSFAWAYANHSSASASDFFDKVQKVFPYPIERIQTDNGSEFAKHFSQKIKDLCLTHYHIYPKTPQHNAHIERYNRTLQEEYINYHMSELMNPDKFNRNLMDYLLWYNTKRPHWSLNSQSPLQFLFNQDPKKSKSGWTYTKA